MRSIGALFALMAFEFLFVSLTGTAADVGA